MNYDLLEREIHDLDQGSPEWHVLRQTKLGASEAAAMLGLSRTTKRNELLHMKVTATPKVFSEWMEENVLAEGHRVEALARPHAEAYLCEDLYPQTISLGRLSASCDGLTMDGAIAWEHKQWSERLAEHLRRGELPEEHMPQCQQVLLCTGAQRLLFTVSDGTPEKMLHLSVAPDPAWFARIKVGWEQFESDMLTYTPPEKAPVVVAAVQPNLPALSVRVDGTLAVVSNLKPFGIALHAFVDRIPTKPTTDQEFADVEAACKKLKEAEERLAATEDSALASMTDVEEMRRLVADFRNVARTARLTSEKVVAARKVQIRDEEVARGRRAVLAHVEALNERLGERYMPQMPCDFLSAIKSLRTMDSLRNAIDTTIANFKIQANEVADRITVNMRALADAGDKATFPDAAQLVLKAPEDLRAVIANRVAEAERKLEEQRETIRREEAAKADRERRQGLQSELVGLQQQVMIAAIGRLGVRAGGTLACAQDTLAETEAWPLLAEHWGDMLPLAQSTKAKAIEDIRTIVATRQTEAQTAELQRQRDVQAIHEPTSNNKPEQADPEPLAPALAMRPPAPAANEVATLRLGAICDKLGFQLTAAFVAETLKVPYRASAGAAKLYYASDLNRIRVALLTHIQDVLR